MEIDDTNYDIDNRDIEEEMETTDYEQDEVEQEEEREKIETEFFETTYKSKRLQLTAANLDDDLMHPVENDRKHYKFETKTGMKYEAFALYKFKKNVYLFDVKELKSENKEHKMMKFDLADIHQIKS